MLLYFCRVQSKAGFAIKKASRSNFQFQRNAKLKHVIILQNTLYYNWLDIQPLVNPNLYNLTHKLTDALLEMNIWVDKWAKCLIKHAKKTMHT